MYNVFYISLCYYCCCCLKKENYYFLCADCDECMQTISLIPIKKVVIIWCAHNVNGIVRTVDVTRNESENFLDVVDGVNITVAQSQDTGESES